MTDLAASVLKGDRKGISKAISLVENEDPGERELLKEIYPHTGRAFVIGFTGPPGTGKSTIVDQLLKIYRSKGMKIAVLAVDPSSPMSGGAILGDRVRMLSHALDEGIYIRSMASRGDQGGLSRATKNATRILDAAGNDIIFVETVGIGQAEVEIVNVADCVVVVLMPELGDEIQAVKAGLMEIGHIFAVNKSDLPGSDAVIYNILPVLSSKSGWRQQAIKLSAKTGEGIEKLATVLSEFREHMLKSDSEERKQRVNDELIKNVVTSLSHDLKERLARDCELGQLVGRVIERKIDPGSASEILLRKYRITESS